MQLYNETDYAAGLFPGRDINNQEQLTLVVKTSFTYDATGALTTSYEDIIMADEYCGKPGESSLKLAHDIAPYKSRSEIFLTGKAYPIANTNIMEASIKLFQAEKLNWQKSLRIFGKRVWKNTLLGLVPSKPENLAPIDLIYENAYGGVDPINKNKTYSFNPVGKGFSSYGRNLKNQALPQIELAPKFITSTTQKPKPGGFGPLPVDWEPQLQEQGSLTTEKIDVNNNAGPNCHNIAPIDQHFTNPFSSEQMLMLKGLCKDLSTTTELAITLPKINLSCHLVIDNKDENVALRWDTISINTEEQKLYFLHRAGIPWSSTNTATSWVIVTT